MKPKILKNQVNWTQEQLNRIKTKSKRRELILWMITEFESNLKSEFNSKIKDEPQISVINLLREKQNQWIFNKGYINGWILISLTSPAGTSEWKGSLSSSKLWGATEDILNLEIKQ